MRQNLDPDKLPDPDRPKGARHAAAAALMLLGSLLLVPDLRAATIYSFAKKTEPSHNMARSVYRIRS
jgi:hypothetical protein